ncbi:MAG: ATP-binding protein, partial [Longimicrobiales bacterium]
MRGARQQLPPFPFVGRAELVRSIEAELAGAGEGRGGTLLLVGSGGVGKSRLVDAAIDAARRRGFTVAHGRGYPV